VPHISGRDIKAFRFRLPPMPVQCHIAEILDTYDDLIGNNTRRIAILEEMARRLYEEWFVRFRFPGHEQARIANSPLGPLLGWTTSSVRALVDRRPGKVIEQATCRLTAQLL
jgi:type I restriction enzyme S subunit